MIPAEEQAQRRAALRALLAKSLLVADADGEAAERGLRVGAGEYGEGQTQGDVPAAAERFLVVSAGRMGRVGQFRGGLEQPRRFGIRHETPSGLTMQPLAQLRQMPPDQDESLPVGVGDQQRPGEQGAQRGPELRLLLGPYHGVIIGPGP